MVPRAEFESGASDMINIADQVSGDGLVPAHRMTVGAVVYLSVFFTLLVMSFLIMCWKMSTLGQKTRTPPQRRVYVGSRARPSLSQAEPTIYVSPNNLPPPPKYECLAPPSYEEVVGIHYPQYQNQPITTPITAAMAQSAPMAHASGPVNVTVTDPPPTVITVTSERTSVHVAAS